MANFTASSIHMDTALVSVRPVQPNDLTLLNEMHQRLSPESVYFRYLHYRVPSVDELEAICQIPAEKGAGFVATIEIERERIVGVAYYIRDEHADLPHAEIGILIEDQFQGQGIGRKLWQAVHQHANGNQIRKLRVLFSPTNWRMLRLIKGSGYPYQASAEDDLNDFMVVLTQERENYPPPGSTVQQLLERFGLPILKQLFRHQASLGK